MNLHIELSVHRCWPPHPEDIEDWSEEDKPTPEDREETLSHRYIRAVLTDPDKKVRQVLESPVFKHDNDIIPHVIPVLGDAVARQIFMYAAPQLIEDLKQLQ